MTRSLSLAAAVLVTLIAVPPATAGPSTPLADSIGRAAAANAPAMAQGPGSPFAPRVQRRAPALMPLLIGAGVGCAFGAFVGYSLEEGEKVTRVWTGARACASGGALGALIGWVVSSR